jgi:hypothetical protein
MKNTNKILIFIVLNTIVLTVNGQETSSFNFGYNFIKDKPTFDLMFNRQSPTKASDDIEIKLIKDAFVLNPAAEAHWGAGTDNSSNNLIFHLNSYYKNQIEKKKKSFWVSLYKINLISPQFTCDKDFKVYQGFSTIGVNYISYYSKRDEWGYVEYNLGVNFDSGFSKIDSISKAVGVFRTKIYPSFQWQFWGKKSNENIPPEIDPKFYYKGEFMISYDHFYFFKQDKRIIDDSMFGYLTLKISYRLIKSLKVSFIYVNGKSEPLYKDINSLSVGFALIN